jgi:hypothetical protein
MPTNVNVKLFCICENDTGSGKKESQELWLQSVVRGGIEGASPKLFLVRA